MKVLKRIKYWFRYKYFSYKYRGYDETICCCGCIIGDGGSICAHGGCRSAKEYAIHCATYPSGYKAEYCKSCGYVACECTPF